MMRKICALLVITVCIAVGCRKELPAPEPSNATKTTQEDLGPQYAARVTCFIGEIGSRSNCSTIIAQSSQKVANFEVTQKLSCGHPDRVSDIEWNFIGHKDNRDLYNFKRTFPIDTNEYTTALNLISFDGNQAIIFQDEYQVIVIDDPDGK